MKVVPVEVPHVVNEMDESLSTATSVAQLSTPLFMKVIRDMAPVLNLVEHLS